MNNEKAKYKHKSKKKKKVLLLGEEELDPNAIFMRQHLRVMLGDMGESFPYHRLASQMLFG